MVKCDFESIKLFVVNLPVAHYPLSKIIENKFLKIQQMCYSTIFLAQANFGMRAHSLYACLQKLIQCSKLGIAIMCLCLPQKIHQHL